MRSLMIALILCSSAMADDRHPTHESDQKGNPWRWTEESGGYYWRWNTSSVALDEVNAQRAAAGLRPYLPDPGLTTAAMECATYRANGGIQGHTGNDFAFLPAGTSSPCAGCAAWQSGFGACAILDNYTYCGAAVIERNGLWYCHCFYR